MITPSALSTGTVLQSSGPSLSPGVLALIGIAAAVVIALVWLLTQSSSD